MHKCLDTWLCQGIIRPSKSSYASQVVIVRGNAGSSFCCPMEQCLGDQQFATLLLYLDDIHIFALSIEEMLDYIDLVFSRLKEFHLKIKPKKCYFFDTSVLFLGHVLSSKGISANPKKVDKVWHWLIPMSAKESSFLFGFGFILLESSVCMSWSVQPPTSIKN